MREKLIALEVSSRPTKKYMAIVRDSETGRTRRVHFGARGYEQYRDSTPLRHYAHMDHKDRRRRRNYYLRHSSGRTSFKGPAVRHERQRSHGHFTPRLLSHLYLW